MNILEKLFGRTAVPLTADTPDGAYIEVSGIARALEGVETIVPPVSGVVCVVARIRYVIPVTGSPNKHAAPTRIERFHNRPFELETDDLDVIVDSEFLEIDVVERREAATSEEASVPVGARITVRGTLRRDVDRPDSDAMFRETQFVYTITGSEESPVEITASVSDDDGG